MLSASLSVRRSDQASNLGITSSGIRISTVLLLITEVGRAGVEALALKFCSELGLGHDDLLVNQGNHLISTWKGFDSKMSEATIEAHFSGSSLVCSGGIDPGFLAMYRRHECLMEKVASPGRPWNYPYKGVIQTMI